MTGAKKGIPVLVRGSAAVFWPGAFIFGFPGVMGPFWQERFRCGQGDIGNTLFFVQAAVGIFMFSVGRWQERLGTRTMALIGPIVCASGVLVTAYAPNLGTLYFGSFLNGAASCFVYIPALTVVQQWYPGRRGLVSGIVTLSFAASAAMMVPIFGFLLHAWGYVPMSLVLALTAFSMGAMAARFLESPVQGFTIHNPGRVAAPRPGPPKAMTVAESLRTGSFWFLWLGWAFQGAAGIAMVTLSVPFGLSRGLPFRSAVLILTAFSLPAASAVW